MAPEHPSLSRSASPAPPSPSDDKTSIGLRRVASPMPAENLVERRSSRAQLSIPNINMSASRTPSPVPDDGGSPTAERKKSALGTPRADGSMSGPSRRQTLTVSRALSPAPPQEAPRAGSRRPSLIPNA